MNSYGPRVLVNIWLGCMSSMSWLKLTLLSPQRDLATSSTSMLGLLAWSLAIVYLLSYRFPQLRQKYRLPLTLPLEAGLVLLGYFSVGSIQGREQAIWLSWYALIPVALLAGPLAISSLMLWIWRSQWFRELFRYGDGDNAQWATRNDYHRRALELPPITEGSMGWTDKIILGSTTFRHDVTPRLVGLETNVHLLTIGMSNSGKSATAVWLNLATYSGCTFQIDIKGEHVRNTLKRRLRLGPAWNNDPLGITGIPSCRFNPLADVDETTDEGLRLIAEIRKAIIIPEDNMHSGTHFADNAGTILEGVITWVCHAFPPETRNLVSAYEIIASRDPESGVYDPSVWIEAVTSMSECHIGNCTQAAKLMDDAGAPEGGSFLTTLSKSIKWVAPEGMKVFLSGNDYSMKDLAATGDRRTSIYVAVGLGNEEDFSRYIRLMSALAIYHLRAEYRRTGQRATPKPLIGLDEFSIYAKGLECISTGFGNLREVCMLWVQCQKLSQLKEVLGEKAKLLLQSSTLQAFGVSNDHDDMAKWISEQIGYHIVLKREGFLAPKKRFKEPLMTLRAVQDTLRQLSPNQFVFPADGGPPMWLHRRAYKPFKIDGKQVFEPLDLGDAFDTANDKEDVKT